jgi:hypothetical protein
LLRILNYRQQNSPAAPKNSTAFWREDLKLFASIQSIRNRSGGCRALHISTLLFAAFAQPPATSHF